MPSISSYTHPVGNDVAGVSCPVTSSMNVRHISLLLLLCYNVLQVCLEIFYVSVVLCENVFCVCVHSSFAASAADKWFISIHPPSYL